MAARRSRSKPLGCFRNKKIIGWLSIVIFLCILGCSPLEIKRGVFSPPDEKYTVHIPDSGWEPIKLGKEDLALWHKQYHATIAFISSNVKGKKGSLEALDNQLFIGMKHKRIVLKDFVLVDNQRAMHTILTCELDNHELKIDSYVIQSGDRVYDLVYWASSDSFNRTLGDFENIVKSFKFSNYHGAS